MLKYVLTMILEVALSLSSAKHCG